MRPSEVLKAIYVVGCVVYTVRMCDAPVNIRGMDWLIFLPMFAVASLSWPIMATMSDSAVGFAQAPCLLVVAVLFVVYAMLRGRERPPAGECTEIT